MGIYCASKATLEVLSDDYNATLQGSGVESVQSLLVGLVVLGVYELMFPVSQAHS